MTQSLVPVLGDDPDRLLAPSELGELLGGISDRTLRQWAADGTGPRRLRIGGKHIRYRAADVRAWLASRYLDTA